MRKYPKLRVLTASPRSPSIGPDAIKGMKAFMLKKGFEREDCDETLADEVSENALDKSNKKKQTTPKDF